MSFLDVFFFSKSVPIIGRMDVEYRILMVSYADGCRENIPRLWVGYCLMRVLVECKLRLGGS